MIMILYISYPVTGCGDSQFMVDEVALLIYRKCRTKFARVRKNMSANVSKTADLTATICICKRLLGTIVPKICKCLDISNLQVSEMSAGLKTAVSILARDKPIGLISICLSKPARRPQGKGIAGSTHKTTCCINMHQPIFHVELENLPLFLLNDHKPLQADCMLLSSFIMFEGGPGPALEAFWTFCNIKYTRLYQFTIASPLDVSCDDEPNSQ